jgi:hypothetical protein
MLPDWWYGVPTVAPDTGRVKPPALLSAAWVVVFAEAAEDEDLDACEDFEDFEDFGEESAEDEEEVEPDDLAVPAAALLPIDSSRPGWISEGSAPTASRLSWYSLFQPPLTCCSVAIFER